MSWWIGDQGWRRIVARVAIVHAGWIGGGMVGCEATVYDGASGIVDAGDDDATGAGGGFAGQEAGGTASVGGEGVGDTVSDSGTLAVAIDVFAYAAPGTPARETAIQLTATVLEWQTDAPVADAIITMTPLRTRDGAEEGRDPDSPGPHEITLAYSVYTEATYFATTVGYTRWWRLSVERGDDRLTGLVLAGPSLHAVTLSSNGESPLVSWSPASEPMVRSSACVEPGEDSPERTVVCEEGDDPGTAVLAPVSRGDRVWVNRRTKQPMGIGGAGRVELVVVSDVL